MAKYCEVSGVKLDEGTSDGNLIKRCAELQEINESQASIIREHQWDQLIAEISDLSDQLRAQAAQTLAMRKHLECIEGKMRAWSPAKHTLLGHVLEHAKDALSLTPSQAEERVKRCAELQAENEIMRKALIEIGGPQEWQDLLDTEADGFLDYFDGFRRAEIARNALEELKK